ncbi:hypothetical protein [Kyrpidia spormannii]|uniref:Uncharacterized protein n=1 Tax=Kyrpidia spormannii TaxID=2055160 RepID=A0ACA8ZCK3_9BACL|nr:hypothetical protein [Kyrpidia spormannii]CAB3395236.1 conserved protein of unknown function [Kyrpidia spormannii]
MSTAFSKEEMLQANQFRALSQRELQKRLKTHEKLGILFANQGLGAVMLSYERYEALVNRLNDLENLLEDIELEQTFGYRLNTPADEWVAHPEGASTLEMYHKRKRGRDGQ